MRAACRYAIINHVVHLVNRDYEAMARDYYALDFLDRSVDVRPIVPALAAFFDDVLEVRPACLSLSLPHTASSPRMTHMPHAVAPVGFRLTGGSEHAVSDPSAPERVSTTQIWAKWEGCLHFTAPLTTLAPPSRQWPNCLKTPAPERRQPGQQLSASQSERCSPNRAH